MLFKALPMSTTGLLLSKRIARCQITTVRNWCEKVNAERPPGTKRPATVLVLGWGTSEKKENMKFAKLYHKHGIDSILCSPPYTTEFHDVKNCREVEDLAQAIAELPEDEPLLLQLNSHNGPMTLGSLLMKHPELRVFERTAGMIIDSAPIPPFLAHTRVLGILYDYAYFVRVFYGPERPSMIKHLLWKPFPATVFFFKTLLVQAAAKMGFDVRKYNCYEYLVTHPNIPPVVALIYTDMDIVCPAYYIDQFGQRLRKRGVNVMERRFQDSLHIRLLYDHPEKYAAFVDEFIATSLSRWKSNSKDKK